jgi:hypothetical protein
MWVVVSTHLDQIFDSISHLIANLHVNCLIENIRDFFFRKSLETLQLVSKWQVGSIIFPNNIGNYPKL